VDHTTMLVNLLKLHFGWHLARIKCLASIIVALFKIKTVNLTEVATACPGTAEIESHDKRLQRFFKQVESKPSLIATCVVAFLPYETSTLSMDRTNWMLGCFNSNFLVLSVVHEGIAFPVLWLFLHKKGNANTKERMQLIDKFIEIFGVEKIDCLLDLLYALLLTPVASRNLLLYQSLPISIACRHANVRRRKDDPPMGTASRGIIE